MGAYSGILPKPIERQTFSARSHFRMTLDKQPFVSSDVRPLRVSGLPVEQDVKHQEDEVPQQWNPDMDLYADYEMMYSQASEEAHEATANVIASQRYEAYLTELTRRLCEMGVPEEETFLHISNHHAYKDQYNELTLFFLPR